MPTLAQQRLIDAVLAAVTSDPRIESLWLSGSLGAGVGDEWSDVDLIAVVTSGEGAEAVADAYARDLDLVTQGLHVVRPFPRLISVVGRVWERFDLQFMTATDLANQDARRLSSVFARPGAAGPGAGAPPRAPAPFDVERTAREFLRIIGLGPGVMARGHFLMAVDGMSLLRNLCIDLMLAETGHSRADASPKRLESLLTDEQREALRGLPPLAATQDSVIAMQTALCRLFLPRARAFANSQGATWPEEFEAATRTWVRHSLGVELD